MVPNRNMYMLSVRLYPFKRVTAVKLGLYRTHEAINRSAHNVETLCDQSRITAVRCMVR